jgi:two-component system cell cycle sensor histidine kinase/response regulator CckA
MNKEIRVLLLEDSAADAELVQRELQKAELPFNSRWVTTEESYLNELRNFMPNIVLADSNLPQFNSLQAYRLLREQGLDIPFLVVTGTLNEELKKQYKKQGVDDYVPKSALDQLPSAIWRSLQKGELRSENTQSLMTFRRTEDHYRLIAENMRDLICLMDREGRFIYVSPSVKEVLGHPPEELIGQNCLSLIHPDDRQAAWNMFQESSLVKNRRPVEYRCRHSQGNWVFLESVTSWIFDDRGKPFKAVIVSRDITQRRHLEEQLRQSQKMDALGRLAGGVAHDFNNMLTAILGFCEMLLMHLDRPNDIRRDTEQIRRAGQRAAGLARQLLAFSRTKVHQPQVLDLNQAVLSMSKMLHRLIGEDIELINDLKANFGNVNADPGQLEQVIMNLVVNARDAMPNGGQLTLATSIVEVNETNAVQHSVAFPATYVLLEVRDTGTGMDAVTQSHIFEPLFTTKELGKGTGLGLSTVFAIVAQSEGAIRVQSEPGRGTNFKTYFPKVDERLTAGPEECRTSPELLHTAGTILLVEDEELVRKMVHDVLVRSGYQVLEAANGWDALQLAKEYADQIDLVLTDMVMPQMNGQELARRLACLRSNTKVLYMTGYNDERTKEAGRSETDPAYLCKPFTTRTLTQLVRETLEKKTQTKRQGAVP